MPLYYKCYMKPYQHVLVYIVCSALATVIVYLFYHLLVLSLCAGLALGLYLERMVAFSTVRRRQRNLRSQFRVFLESMSVATRAGGSPSRAMYSALGDLKLSYREDADIVVEIENILERYEKGGVPLHVLFQDMADRSNLEDIQSFASIYEVIEGKNNRIGDILTETSEIIGEKMAIEQEIETTISAAKSETYMMLVMPILMILVLTFMGGGLMSSLFTTLTGHLAATAALVLFVLAYIISVKVTDIQL